MLIEKHLGSQKALHLRCEKGRYAVPRVDRKKLREREREVVEGESPGKQEIAI